MTLVDPLVGDELYVIPGSPGRAMTNERNYLEFAALQTASGMALLPYVDDLITTIDTTRVTITRKGGLSLAAPSMPLTNSSQIGAAGSEGPCFLDFARWSRISGGSFLVTERRLRAATARLKSEDANHARLVLARFLYCKRIRRRGTRSRKHNAIDRPSFAKRHAVANHSGCCRLLYGPLSRRA